MDRYNFRPALRRLLHEPDPPKRIRSASQQSVESPMKAKIPKVDGKVIKVEKQCVKLLEQRDEARTQLKTVNAELKRCQDALRTANKQIGSLESTIAKFKEKPLPPAKPTVEVNELKDLVSKSVKEILDEIKGVRTSHVSLHQAVANLVNAPIEITQPALPPVPPQRHVPLPVGPQIRQQLHDGTDSSFLHGPSQSREYVNVAPRQLFPMDYWRNGAGDQYGHMQLQPQAYAPPEYVAEVSPITAPQSQIQVRRVVPPEFGLPPPLPVDSNSVNVEVSFSDPKKKRGRK